MHKTFLPLFIGSFFLTLHAQETNATLKAEISKKQVQEQIEREKKYAKEQVFYQGSDYNLSEAEVDKKSLSGISVMKPDYDFDMDNVYSEEQ